MLLKLNVQLSAENDTCTEIKFGDNDTLSTEFYYDVSCLILSLM